MNTKVDFPTIVLLGIIVFMLLGAALIYPLNHNEFKSEVTTDSTSIYVNMHSSILSDYTVCAVDLDNNSKRSVLFYYDENYESMTGHADELSMMEKTESHLKYLNVEYSTINANELKEVLTETTTSQTKSIVVFSGAFPCNVYAYDGTLFTTDLVKPWMEAGGIVYWWSDAKFGHYSSPLTNDFVNWGEKQPLYFSATEFGLDFDETLSDEDESSSNNRSQISNILNIEQNILNHSSVKGSATVLNLGFESDDGRYSIAYAKYGSGGAVIMNGGFSPEKSMAKIIASKVCDWANYNPAVQTGQFKGDCQITFDKSGVDAVYIYFGTLTPRYGELVFI